MAFCEPILTVFFSIFALGNEIQPVDCSDDSWCSNEGGRKEAEATVELSDGEEDTEELEKKKREYRKKLENITDNNWLIEEQLVEYAKAKQKEYKDDETLVIPSGVFDKDAQLVHYLNDNFKKGVTKRILVVVHANHHWMLGAISLKNSLVSLFDSMNGKQTIRFFRRFVLIIEILRKLGAISSSLEDFAYETVTRTPQQLNSDDCDVFVCSFILQVLSKLFTVTINAASLRKEILDVLKKSSLIEEVKEQKGLVSKSSAEKIVSDSMFFRNFLSLSVNRGKADFLDVISRV